MDQKKVTGAMDKDKQSRDWYEIWFNQIYASLYSHRNQEQAENQVGALLSAIQNPKNIVRVLDIACGGGRHVSALQNQLNPMNQMGKAGKPIVIGMDLSWDLLQTVDTAVRTQSHFLRGDMRNLPFLFEGFDLVTSFFSSYGYFKTPEEDKKSLEGMITPLKVGGYFFLDLMNKEAVLQNLVSKDSKQMGDWNVVQERRLEQAEGIEGNVIVKDIYLEPSSPSAKNEKVTNHHYQERLRVYSLKEMERIFVTLNLKVLQVFGTEKGDEYNESSSPRMSFLLQKQ